MKLFFFGFLLAHADSQKFVEVTGDVMAFSYEEAKHMTLKYAEAARQRSNIKNLFVIGVQIQECPFVEVSENV